ncbi:Hypothetical_protein [Hexamita inflata]|uniref:Hypothetical_protein n=1 Tax=Hexamita inflata TaxID=28002 RepID=A0AA86PFM7_9EUKA|nr:Hypothetical protein HINF_LOCUS24896 [Hexamita inflata]CAI9937254.1 Hypothetical protein HINF_LOCUS24899 [Hexamita inflata]
MLEAQLCDFITGVPYWRITCSLDSDTRSRRDSIDYHAFVSSYISNLAQSQISGLTACSSDIVSMAQLLWTHLCVLGQLSDTILLRSRTGQSYTNSVVSTLWLKGSQFKMTFQTQAVKYQETAASTAIRFQCSHNQANYIAYQIHVPLSQFKFVRTELTLSG